MLSDSEEEVRDEQGRILHSYLSKEELVAPWPKTCYPALLDASWSVYEKASRQHSDSETGPDLRLHCVQFDLHSLINFPCAPRSPFYH